MRSQTVRGAHQHHEEKHVYVSRLGPTQPSRRTPFENERFASSARKFWRFAYKFCIYAKGGGAKPDFPALVLFKKKKNAATVRFVEVKRSVWDL